MDTLIYEDSPLAEYWEGDAIPFETSIEATPPPPSFAPQGVPNLKDKLRSIRRSATSIQPKSSEQILEQFRYIVVASQLLSDEAHPRPIEYDESKEREKSLLQGAVATAILSFTVAYTLNWLRSRQSAIKTLTWLELGVYCICTFCLGIAALLFMRRQYSKWVQRHAAGSLTRLVNDSQAFDLTAGKTLRFIQEIELVARGYDLTTPLPPITRLEDKQAIKRCQILRSTLIESLTVLISRYVDSHNILQAFVVPQDLQRYHDIYEISLTEYSDAVKIVNESSEETKSALKELRFAIRSHAVARRVFLCDLLSLRTTHGWHRVRQWRSVQSLLKGIEEETMSRQQTLSNLLHEEEFGPQPVTQNSAKDPNIFELTQSDSASSQQFKMHMRRFEDVTQSIRALNAKVHILREEISGLTSARTDEAVVASALSKHYEALGTDIRALQIDWERGKNAMLLNVGADMRSRPGSLSPRSPMSPTPSLGGSTVVDGGPAEALRLLNGDNRSSRSSDGTLFDEEVFEAISKPQVHKRMSMGGLTREEKIAKLNEERRKRATLQEQADTTTNMLRELQMVIKHRPHNRTPSTPSGPRIVSV